ncbi:hypothetical protein NECAME_19142 [Necator americanus]|uniref:Ammonium transporter AmtB-like domain-containing protein n=1 Tax=Necator americanus TaxID=51031 RepID=W2SSR1_NECAM|nr:hypothetical protein NECAME_19142 [Necator americanus]ETN71876.1 hypothetical protein NECAME_19142 [Necator americanus]
MQQDIVVGIAAAVVSAITYGSTWVPVRWFDTGDGNALTIYIMDGIGMAVGSLLWNTITCVVGWAVTRFGLLWNPQQLPHDNILNFIGVVVVCVG